MFLLYSFSFFASQSFFPSLCRCDFSLSVLLPLTRLDGGSRNEYTSDDDGDDSGGVKCGEISTRGCTCLTVLSLTLDSFLFPLQDGVGIGSHFDCCACLV